MKSTKFSLTALAMIGMAVFAGCSANNNDDAASGESSSSASEETSSAATSEESSSASSDNPFNNSSESAEASESASESSSSDQEAKTPEGYQTLTAEGSGVSFAVPGDWETITHQEVTSSDSAAQKKVESIASDSSMTADQIKQQMQDFDLMTLASERDETDFKNNINVLKDPVNSSILPTEEDMKGFAQQAGGEPGKYETVETPLGEAATMTYSIETSQKSYGKYLIVPTGSGDSYAIITVSAGTPEGADGIGKTVLESLAAA